VKTACAHNARSALSCANAGRVQKKLLCQVTGIEGEAITPMLMARRFTLNPVLVILSLIFRYWMWGVPGAILAVPMLAFSDNANNANFARP
jgi:AI-2E family transporter